MTPLLTLALALDLDLALDPFSMAFFDDPYPGHAAMREAAPVVRPGHAAP